MRGEQVGWLPPRPSKKGNMRMQRLGPTAQRMGRAPGVPPPMGRAHVRATGIVTGPPPLDDRPMNPAETSSALRALPRACRDALRTGDDALMEEVARLRDELHAVANRVARLLAAPGSALASMDIGSPTALAGPSSPGLLVAVLTMTAERLASMADRLGEEDWRVIGHLGTQTVTIGQLVALPLHSAHRILAAASGALHDAPPEPVKDAQPTHRRADVAVRGHSTRSAIPERVGQPHPGGAATGWDGRTRGRRQLSARALKRTQQ